MKLNFYLLRAIINNTKKKPTPSFKEIFEWTKKATIASLNQADRTSTRITRIPGWNAFATGMTLFGVYKMSGLESASIWAVLQENSNHDPLPNLENEKIEIEKSNGEENFRKIAKEEFEKLINEKERETNNKPPEESLPLEEEISFIDDKDDEIENQDSLLVRGRDGIGEIIHRLGKYLQKGNSPEDELDDLREKLLKAPTHKPSPKRYAGQSKGQGKKK